MSGQSFSKDQPAEAGVAITAPAPALPVQETQSHASTAFIYAGADITCAVQFFNTQPGR